MKRYLTPSSYVRAINRGLRRLVCRYAGIEEWHATPIRDRPYAVAVVKHLNELDSAHERCIAEIGCGLGEILRSVEWSHRDGFDADEGVIRVARVISRFRRDQGMRFEVAALPGIVLNGRYDAIVMVNWIHHIDKNTLSSSLRYFSEVNLKKNGIIVIDTVGDPAYRFNHDINELAVVSGMSYTSLGKFDRSREVFVLQRNSQSKLEVNLGDRIPAH